MRRGNLHWLYAGKRKGYPQYTALITTTELIKNMKEKQERTPW